MELAGDFLRACHDGRWFKVSVVRCVLLMVAVAELCLMLCPDRDTLLNVSARYLWVQWVSGSMVQWFRRGLDDQVETEDERSSGETMNCQNKTKTKLRSTTDTQVILIVESPQLIVNKRMQMRHCESYGRNWKVQE